MGSMTIRNLDDALKSRLRIRAATHGKSMEEEVRDILRSVLDEVPQIQPNLFAAIRAHVTEFGGVDLPEIPREPMRDLPRFD